MHKWLHLLVLERNTPVSIICITTTQYTKKHFSITWKKTLVMNSGSYIINQSTLLEVIK